VTGLFRTTLFFFLPIFGGLLLYQWWSTDPYVKREVQNAYMGKYTGVLTEVETAATAALEWQRNQTGPAPSLPDDENFLFAEAIRNEGSVLRLLGPLLAETPGWGMIPDPSAAPSFLTGFRITAGTTAIRCFLVERTVYDSEGNPVALNIYIREEFPSQDESI